MLYEKEGMNSSKKEPNSESKLHKKPMSTAKSLPTWFVFWNCIWNEIEFGLLVVVVLMQKRLQHVWNSLTFLICELIFLSHRISFLFWKKKGERKTYSTLRSSLSSHPRFSIYRNGKKIGICNTICIILCKILCQFYANQHLYQLPYSDSFKY